MSFKLTNKDLDQREFFEALEELANKPLCVHTSYNIGKIMKALDKIQRESKDFFRQNILDKYAKKDENGKIAMRMTPELKDKDGNVVKKSEPVPGTFVIDETKVEEFTKAMDEFFSIEHEVNCNKIKLYDLDNCRVTPKALAVLDILIDDSPRSKLAIATDLPK